MSSKMRLQLGKKYKTTEAGLVEIIKRETQGRKPFIGVLEKSGEVVTYFRNGNFCNASSHKYNIVEEIDTSSGQSQLV